MVDRDGRTDYDLDRRTDYDLDRRTDYDLDLDSHVAFLFRRVPGRLAARYATRHDGA
jgi:hypothetical protein